MSTNRDSIHHEQVLKRQTYALAEGADEAFDEETVVETCDLRSASFAQDLGEALENLGFAILVGHGVDQVNYRRCVEAIPRVFAASIEDKLRFRAQRFGSVNQGYFPIAETSQLHPDQVEGWVFCRRAFAPPMAGNYWPDPALEPLFRAHWQAHEVLVAPIMQAILGYLGCDPHLYDDRLCGTNFGLRLNYYPPMPESGAGRLLGHEDVDLFTLLPAPDIPGLQVLNRRNFKWIRLEAPPGSIILNTGDYLQRISNDRLPSTTHRVSVPRDPAARALSRVSLPMAIYLWEDEVLEVLPGLGDPHYPPIRTERFHTLITSKFYGDDYA